MPTRWPTSSGGPDLGGFEVRVVPNETAAVVLGEIEEFLGERRPSDLALLHFSGHGLKDAAGELHLAAEHVLVEALQRQRLAGLAYEIVINSNPVICYIMEENSMTMQTLVMAHAAFGHNHFFKNNYLFRQWTDAGGILDYLAFARDYVAKCEEMHGMEAVERVLDAAHALEGARGQPLRPSLETRI